MNKENDNGSGAVKEPHATYTSRSTSVRRPPAKDIVDRLRRFRRQYPLTLPEGKSIVDLVREERER